MSHRYQPFYCEENVWWLGQEPRFEGRARFAVFVSNPAKQCAMWQQRAAARGQAVLWDYHVILVVGGEVWDLDTRLGKPVALERYLRETFRPVEATLAPRFRVVAFEEMLATLRTDRSHMRTAAGDYLKPPPAWEPLATSGSNLLRFVNMGDPIAGVVVDLERLPGALGLGLDQAIRR